MSCTSDPFSCSNLAHVDPGGSTNQSLNGLAWETDNVLTELGNDGNRPSQCWNLSMYDDFNVQNAQAYCKIAWCFLDLLAVRLADPKSISLFQTTGHQLTLASSPSTSGRGSAGLHPPATRG